MGELQYQEITEQIIGAAFEVHRILGYGFAEIVYHKAMQVELRLRGVEAVIKQPVSVRYKGVVVGDFEPDMFAAQQVIVEFKVDDEYHAFHEPQVLNYLRATEIKVGLLINFGKRKVDFKRLVY